MNKEINLRLLHKSNSQKKNKPKNNSKINSRKKKNTINSIIILDNIKEINKKIKRISNISKNKPLIIVNLEGIEVTKNILMIDHKEARCQKVTIKDIIRIPKTRNILRNNSNKENKNLELNSKDRSNNN